VGRVGPADPPTCHARDPPAADHLTMSLSTVLFLFLAHLGIGITATLVLVSREAGVKFFRFNAGLAAVLIAVALAFRPTGPDAGATSPAALGALVIAEFAIVIYWATVGRTLASIRPALVVVGIGAGTLAMVLQALVAAADRALPMQALTIASFLSSAALLGGACTAMILGHWYLIIPSMQVSHLQSIVKLHIASMIVRVVVVGAAVFLAIATWQPGLGPSFRHYILSAGGIFFWQRVLFGLGGPALLSVLTWETAKIRSTQSATGILYVDFFTVVVGEVLAKYLLLATRVPV
jgi:protein NrfD